MRNLNDTIARLSALRTRPMNITSGAAQDRLRDLADFGSNPGALRARYYVPETLGGEAALVVVLHGCTQTAAGYDHGSGWSRLADEHGFALLFPEQRQSNNLNLCFNWFNPDDIRRGSGEALSIRQMVAAMLGSHPIDTARVFVTGLSAGGAMTSVMLASYPDVFAGGAIIAGLPFGTAQSIPEAFDRMRAHGGARGAALGALVTSASDHEGRWPTVSIWHGTSDQTVSPANAALIVEQWRALHRVAPEPSHVEHLPSHVYRRWDAADGRALIEEYSIAGMGHGTPISAHGVESCGAAMPFMLEVGLSSTRRIASSWGLTHERQTDPHIVLDPAPAVPDKRPTIGPSLIEDHAPAARQPVGRHDRVQRVIEDALRAAGLMR